MTVLVNEKLKNSFSQNFCLLNCSQKCKSHARLINFCFKNQRRKEIRRIKPLARIRRDCNKMEQTSPGEVPFLSNSVQLDGRRGIRLATRRPRQTNLIAAYTPGLRGHRDRAVRFSRARQICQEVGRPSVRKSAPFRVQFIRRAAVGVRGFSENHAHPWPTVVSPDSTNITMNPGDYRFPLRPPFTLCLPISCPWNYHGVTDGGITDSFVRQDAVETVCLFSGTCPCRMLIISGCKAFGYEDRECRGNCIFSG